MKIIYRAFVCMVFLISLSYADKSCILAFSSKDINPKDKKLFISRFPAGIIQNRDGYYEYRLDDFSTRDEALEELRKVKSYYKDASLVECLEKSVVQKPLPLLSSIDKSDDSNDDKAEMLPSRIQKVSKPISLEEVDVSLNTYHVPLASLDISSVKNRPKITEPEILKEHEIPKLSKINQSQLYDVLGFKRYINTLLESNDRSKEIFYKKKIDYILNDIKKDRYNFDVYASGYVRTGSSISAQLGNAPNINGDYSGAGLSLQANKVLYDGGYKLVRQTYDILYKRLADINELNSKDRLLVLGTSIYSNLYTSQEELKILRNIYRKQLNVTKMIKEGYKKGAKSSLNLIDSKNDLLNIERSILKLEYQYLNDDYILRHSIKSRSKKQFKLYPQKIKLDMLSTISLLQKEAVVHSSDIAKESNLLKIKQANLLYQKRRYIPEVNFNSYVGYGLSTSKVFELGNPGHGTYWELGLNFKLPIYNRNDIRLNEELERLNILKQKATLSLKQRDILIQVEKAYNEIMRTNREIDVVKEQLSLLKKKLKISKERFFAGVSPYRTYSDAIRGFLNYKTQLLTMKQRYIQEVSILSVLVGKRDFYE